ncbi:MAG: SCP2 sterol-binding domain-containing protein [Deltaproteobacteria bacterium]|nr:SCP2 sterol-binding domain-containing protein [Deltaproteobacteria bacterium]
MRKYITEIEQLYKGITGLFGSLDQLPDVKRKVLNTDLLLELCYSDPEGRVIIDATGDKVKVYLGECPAGIEPQVELMMSSDTAHLFWLGKINLIMASATGKIKTAGNVGSVLKLVPVLDPLFKAYADFLRENGMAELIV